MELLALVIRQLLEHERMHTVTSRALFSGHFALYLG